MKFQQNGVRDADYLMPLLGELKDMSFLGIHHNVLALVGAITEKVRGGEVYLIFEYCPHGNIQNFLRSHKDNFVDLLSGLTPSGPLSMGRNNFFNGMFLP